MHVSPLLAEVPHLILCCSQLTPDLVQLCLCSQHTDSSAIKSLTGIGCNALPRHQWLRSILGASSLVIQTWFSSETATLTHRNSYNCPLSSFCQQQVDHCKRAQADPCPVEVPDRRLGLTCHGKLGGCSLSSLVPEQAILPVNLILLLQSGEAVIQPLQHVGLACQPAEVRYSAEHGSVPLDGL